ncbi:MAG: rRNA pseudouridine synthase, partial [Gemmatimonadaceae bacterium]|nr:rRNA pseudouridine synthase [Gemmatimonadaceae bacterium]
EGERLVLAGRVRVNGRIVRDPAFRVDLLRDRLAVDDAEVAQEARVYLALNKPRGLVTTRHDPKARDTVYRCLDGAGLPFVSPVGRLDKASEGLILLTNDTQWASRITSPGSHVDKVYHVQVNVVPTAELATRVAEGVAVANGDTGTSEHLAAQRAQVLRSGDRHGWLEIVLDEGKNRHIRRLLAALDVEVLRLVRVAIGPLALGTLGKGEWRHLTPAEVRQLGGVTKRG